MLRNGLRHGGSRPASRAASRASGESRSPLSAKRASGPQRYVPPLAQARVERVRALDVLLVEVLVVLARARCRGPRSETIRPRSIAYSSGCESATSSQSTVALGEVEAGRPADRLERGLARALERLDERAQLAPRRRAVEAADADVDRVDLAAADERHHVVAGLLQREPALDRRRRVAGELDRAVVAEEVGRVEHVDVERVALDPLAAVEEAAQQPDRLGHLDAAERPPSR